MRATINFEADVDQVHVLMGALAKQEAERLRDAAHILATVQEHQVTEKLSEAMEMVDSISYQLNQYREMLMSFERAKFETMLPQAADTPMQVGSVSDARRIAQTMERFDSFVDRINEGGDDGNANEKR